MYRIDPCYPTHIDAIFHSCGDDYIGIDGEGAIYCMTDGKRTDGNDHKDGWEHPIRVYANHVAMDFDDVFELVEFGWNNYRPYSVTIGNNDPWHFATEHEASKFYANAVRHCDDNSHPNYGKNIVLRHNVTLRQTTAN